MIRKIGNFYGLVDENGTWLLNCRYREIEQISDKLYAVAFGPASNTRIIKYNNDIFNNISTYTVARDYHIEIFHPQKGFVTRNHTTRRCVDNNNKYGILKYSSANTYRTFYGLLSQEGVVLLQPIYDSIDICSKDTFIVKQGKRYCLMTCGGKPITKEYNKITTVDNEIYRCWEGNTVLRPKTKTILDPIIGTGAFSYIDKNGNKIIPGYYTNSRDFNDGLAPFCVDGKWGAIDIAGEVVIECQFEDLLPFHYGFAVAKKDGRYGYISKDGQTKIPFEYHEASSFHLEFETLIVARAKGIWGEIEFQLDGNEITEQYLQEESSNFGWSQEDIDDAYKAAFEGMPEAEWNID